MSAAGPGDGFAAGRASFESVVGFLDGAEAAAMEHAELEAELDTRGRELMRRLLQDHLDLRAGRDERLDAVTDTDGVARSRVESGHTRALTSVFGEVTVTRRAYRARGRANLHPADAALNLPAEKHSHGLRRLAAIEAARGSFDDAVDAIDRATGVRLGKRQVEELADRRRGRLRRLLRAAPATRRPPASRDADVLVLSDDGKGVVMRPDALRPATAKAAADGDPEAREPAVQGRETQPQTHGRGRRRLRRHARAPRTAADILARHRRPRSRHRDRQATGKWLTASVTDDAATVDRRRVRRGRTPRPRPRSAPGSCWSTATTTRSTASRPKPTTRGVDVTIVVDLVHVLEYLWAAAWCFFPEGDPAAEGWVRDRAIAVLDGKASTVAAAIRRTRHAPPDSPPTSAATPTPPPTT